MAPCWRAFSPRTPERRKNGREADGGGLSARGGATFEVRLPAGLRIRAAGMLLSMLLSEATDGLYQHSRSGVLMWRDSGRMLSGQKTLWESGIQNGSRLMLI